MEAQRRFAGQPYPAGMTAFPFRLKGQGFFPGGDGRWRNDDCLQRLSTGIIPTSGVMFVGNDFGTLKSFRKLFAKGYENPPTWRNLKQRIRMAGVPEELVFCTNLIIGLRTDGRALDNKAWVRMPGFLDFCGEFFLYQVEKLKPRLIVVLGDRVRKSMRRLFSLPYPAEAVSQCTLGHHGTSLLHTTHPYGDFGFTDTRKKEVTSILKRVWSGIA